MQFQASHTSYVAIWKGNPKEMLTLAKSITPKYQQNMTSDIKVEHSHNAIVDQISQKQSYILYPIIYELFWESQTTALWDTSYTHISL